MRERPTLACFTLALLYSAVPVAFKLTAIAIMRGYPVTRELQLEVRQKLEHRA